MISTDSTTGANTSGTSQAIVKVSEGGCITSDLKAALESQIIVEFPNALGEDGNIDVLSSTAVNQIVTELVASEEFATLLGATVSEPEYIDTIVTALLASESFNTALDTAIKEALLVEENIETIASQLCNNETFKNCVINIIATSEQIETLVEAKVGEAIVALNLFVCGQEVFTVEAGNVVVVPVSNTDGNNYYFQYQIIAYTPSGGGTSSDGSTITTRTPSQVTILFPQTQPGDSVELYYLRTNCSV